MQIGIIGLGRMGSGVAHRLLADGHQVCVYNRTAEKTKPLEAEGATAAVSIEELVRSLKAPRTVWLYLPSGDVTERHAKELLEMLEPGDRLLDGGNSNYHQTLETAGLAEVRGVDFLDVGTSGGVIGSEKGYCLMIGGSEQAYASLEPAWRSVAQAGGYRRMGPAGSGHYVKMVHNAIEYGMMQSYAEGMELLAASRFAGELRLEEVADLWQHGSIITSFLGGLLAEALREDPALEKVGGRIDSNGEARWAMEDALDLNVPMPAIASALFARHRSGRPDNLANKTVAILRNKFGGHAIEEASLSKEA